MQDQTDILINQNSNSFSNKQIIDQSYQTGPKQKRECRDIIFLIAFFMFMFFTVKIGTQNYELGNPYKLVAPFDSDGVQCGINTAEEYPYLYFVGYNQSNKNFVCVKDCETGRAFENIECLPNSYVQNCDDIIPYQAKKFVSICVPIDNTIYKQVESILQTSFVNNVFSDIVQTGQIYLYIAIEVFLVSVFFMMILRWFTGILTWSMISGIIISSISLGSYFIMNYKQETSQDGELQFLQNEQSFFLLGIVLIIFGIVTLFASIFLYSRIQLSIAVIKAAAVFTKDSLGVFFIPLLSTVYIILAIAAFGGVIVYALSIGEMRFNSASPFGQIKWNDDKRNNFLMYLFGLIWNCELAIGVGSFIIASSAIIWYFNHSPYKSQEEQYPVFVSVYRAFRYHFGSILFGSFVLAFLETISIIFSSIYENIKKSLISTDSNPISQCLLKCAKCSFFLFEKFMQYLSYNAYIMMALKGDNFYRSAKEGFIIFSDNLKQFSIQQGLGFIFSVLGRLFISFIGVGTAYLIIKSDIYYEEHLYSIFTPLVIVFTISFLISSVFMGIFGIAGDAIMMSILADKQSNNGQAKSLPYHLQIFEAKYF